jgi:hypothetical protein
MVTTKDDVGELRANLYLGDLGLWGRLSYVNPDIGHARLGADWGAGPLAIVLSLDEKIGRDLIYDLGSSNGIAIAGRNTTYEIFRLNIPNLQPYSQVDAFVSYEALPWLELSLRPGARIVHGDASQRTAFDANRLLLGGGAYGRFKLSSASGLETTLDYDALFYSRSAESGELRAMGGEKSSHTLSAGVRYTHGDRFVHGRLLGGQDFSGGLGAFARLSSFDTGLAPSFSESVVGGRADARYAFSKYASAYLAYEYAHDSNVFDPQFGGFHLLRTGVQGRF